MLITIIVLAFSAVQPAQADVSRWFEISPRCKPMNCSGSGRRSQRSACVGFTYVECESPNGRPTIVRRKRETFHRHVLDYWTGDLNRHLEACHEALAEMRKELTQAHHQERPLGTCSPE